MPHQNTWDWNISDRCLSLIAKNCSSLSFFTIYYSQYNIGQWNEKKGWAPAAAF